MRRIFILQFFFHLRLYRIVAYQDIFKNRNQLRLYERGRGQGGRFFPNDRSCPPFRFTQNTFSNHHVTTRKQTLMEKEIITFKHNSGLKFSQFFAKLVCKAIESQHVLR